jgi:hypothetical protein
MADNMIQTILQILEGVVAPSIADIKGQVITIDKRLELSDRKLDLMEKEMEVRFKAIMGAIEPTRAQIALEHTKMYAELRERVAVIESQLRPKQ